MCGSSPYEDKDLMRVLAICERTELSWNEEASKKLHPQFDALVVDICGNQPILCCDLLALFLWFEGGLRRHYTIKPKRYESH